MTTFLEIKFLRQVLSKLSFVPTILQAPFVARCPVQITAIQEKQYDDAFTLQYVEPELVEIFHYMAGMVPIIQKLVTDVSHWHTVFVLVVLSNPDLSSHGAHRTETSD